MRASPRTSRPAATVTVALLALAAAPAAAGVFTLIQGAADVAPTAPPPFAHWDLRRFAICEVPYAVGRTPAGLAAGVATAQVDAAFGVWQGVEPALLRFRNVGAAPANTSANDGHNTLFWDNNLCNGDPWDASLLGGAIGVTAARMNAATGIYPDVDVVFDDAHFTWTNGTQTFPAGDDVYAVEVLGNGSRRTVISTGANGVCESIALCGDVQVVAVGVNGGANTVGVRTGNAPTFPPAAAAPLIGSIRNLRGQMDVWNITAHEVGHFCGLGENNGANTGSEVNESFNTGPFNIPNGTTLSFTINGNPVAAALTAGAARTAADIAADLNAAIGAQQAGAGNAIANADGSVEIRATVAGQPVIVTGDAAAVAALGFLTGESGMSTMNQPDRRGLNSLDQRTLSRHDTDGLNFLYTQDLGDATDPATGPQGRYQTLVHGPAGATTLNGVALLNAGVGAGHLFGHAPNRYEWLGPREDGSNLECEARVADLDQFDDGFAIAGGRIHVGDSARVTVLVNANDPGGRYAAGAGARRLYFNAYFDWNQNKLFDAGERHVFWNGAPGVTNAASPNFYPSESDLTVNPMVLSFRVHAPQPLIVLSDSTWVRARLDYGEDEGRFANVNADLGPAVGMAQFGEVEDRRFSTFRRVVHALCPPPASAGPTQPAFLQFCVENPQSSPTATLYQISDRLGWITNSDLPLSGDLLLNPVETQCVNVQVTPPAAASVGQVDTVCMVIYAAEGNQRDTCCTTVTFSIPTATKVSRFDAAGQVGRVELRWGLGDPVGVTGFHLYRRAPGGEETRVTPAPIPADGSHEYAFTDTDVEAGVAYDYDLALLGPHGAEERAGSLNVRVPLAAFALGAPMPNPTERGFSIRLGAPRSGFARVRLFDASGRAVATLLDGLLAAGERTLQWDGRRPGRGPVENGLYFVVYEADGRRAVRRLAIVR